MLAPKGCFYNLAKITTTVLNSRIRVLHVIKSLGRGGAEMLLPETLKLHHQDKFEFYYIYFLPWKDQMVPAIEQGGGKVFCFPSNNNIALLAKARALAKFIRDHRIQLIHAHLPWAGVVARIAGKMTGVPVIYTEHNKQERYHFLTRFLNLSTMNWCKEVIAVSADVEQSVKKHKRNLTVQLRTILNGVNTKDFTPGIVSDVRETLGIPAGVPVIGTIAVFRFQKRLDVWMEVAKRILQKHPDVHFIMVGDGPLKNELLQKRKELSMDERIHMPGLKTDVKPFLAAMDIYMMSSIFEGLPIALLEAMAMECAVASTEAGGIKEVIRDHVDGLLCAVDDPLKLVDIVSNLLVDKDLVARFRVAARKRAIEAFSLDKMVSALETEYLSAL